MEVFKEKEPTTEELDSFKFNIRAPNFAQVILLDQSHLDWLCMKRFYVNLYIWSFFFFIVIFEWSWFFIIVLVPCTFWNITPM